MSKPKLTPWFPGSVKPVRPGVYQVRGVYGAGWKKWSGKAWLYFSRSVGSADASIIESSSQSLEWRGLAIPPEVSK